MGTGCDLLRNSVGFRLCCYMYILEEKKVNYIQEILLYECAVASKRIIYPVLIWCQPGLGTVGLSFLVRLLACALVALVSCVG